MSDIFILFIHTPSLSPYNSSNNEETMQFQKPV